MGGRVDRKSEHERKGTEMETYTEQHAIIIN